MMLIHFCESSVTMISKFIFQVRWTLELLLGMSYFRSPFLMTLTTFNHYSDFTDGIKVDLAIATAAKYIDYISRA